MFSISEVWFSATKNATGSELDLLSISKVWSRLIWMVQNRTYNLLAGLDWNYDLDLNIFLRVDSKITNRFYSIAEVLNWNIFLS